ncbi:MAG: glycosyltransferase family 4 protein [Lachnospiraceae bacterium]|nr:glycosyltransferase family 4 protein [Lachnospiraceae bacterium]
MKITMISNYINHHQIPFSGALYAALGENYRFIQTEPMEEERVQMGWAVSEEELPYLTILKEDNTERCKQLILECDLLLAGWTLREDLIGLRLREKKPTVRISERIYREGQWKAVSPKGLIRKYKDHIRYRKAPVWLLCAGAYVASDFALIGAYPGKMYRFGYFPETRHYEEETLEKMHVWGRMKNDAEIQIVWAGRLIPLKHPEYAVMLAEHLKKEGYRFHLHMVGGGELEEALRQQTAEKGLEREITFYGFRSPAYVREIMERSHIHLFTSNRLEGWGTVVNEGMNSGCVVVAGDEAGAIPFLITQGENGLVYHGDDPSDMLRRVTYLLEHPEEGRRMGLRAYRTIVEEWNAEMAAKRLLAFAEGLQTGELPVYERGPLSAAPVIAAP